MIRELVEVGPVELDDVPDVAPAEVGAMPGDAGVERGKRTPARGEEREGMRLGVGAGVSDRQRE